MKKFTFFALLALMPLYACSAADRYDNVYGLWEDYYSGVTLKIKPAKRKGILVKRLDRKRQSNWIRYDRIGRNYYDDCYGNRIRLGGYGLKWTRGHRKSVYLTRIDYSDRHYDSDYDFRYGDRGRGRHYGYDYYTPRHTYLREDISGNWYCSSHHVGIEVGFTNDGIRVRRGNTTNGRNAWYDYKRDRKNSRQFLGDDGNYYELDGSDLYFRDKKNRQKLKFKRG